MELRALADKALTTAKREGASQAEVFAVMSRTVSVYVDDGRIKNAEEKKDQGLALRVLKGRKMAQASTTCTSPEEAEACARAASRLADLSPAARNYDRLPSPAQATLSPKNWDERVAALDPQRLSELLKAVAGAVEDRGAKMPKGMVRAATVESMVLNSNGVDAVNRSTLVFGEFSSMTDGPAPGEGVSSFTSPGLGDFEPQRIGQGLAEQAKAARNAQALEGKRSLPVLIAPGELGEMIELSMGFALSAENVNRRRSPWAGKEGEVVASKGITVLDDPSDPRAVLSAGYDDEGVPTSVKKVIENGALKHFLYDSYNSAASNRPPSGNGIRRSATNSQFLFQSGIGCGHFNLAFRPGHRTQEQMVASLDEGILVEKFAHPDVNAISGGFALEVRLGHVIKGGAITGQIKHALLVGNMYEALKQVREVGSDATVSGSIIVPTLAFDGLEVIGNH